MSKRKNKVIVGMSGGVDSSVAALLLKQQGYEVTGAFIKNWSEATGKKQLCWVDDRRDAIRVAARLDIPFVTFDFEKDFRQHIVDYLYCEYEAGRTPNPDIMCNKMIKFPLLLREARKIGADFIATGHYVRTQEHKNPAPDASRRYGAGARTQEQIYELYKAADRTKDQSYFLYTLDQKILKHCLFPLGDLTKKEVRRIAEENNVPTAKKPDSQGICFVGEMNMRDFLRKRLGEKPGTIVTTDGKIIGKHEGLFFYTIGQRQGIGVGGRAGTGNEPLYVVRKDLKTNTLIVGSKTAGELVSKKAKLENVHWIDPNYGPPSPVIASPPHARGGRGPDIKSGSPDTMIGIPHQQYRDNLPAQDRWKRKLAIKVRYRADDAFAEIVFDGDTYTLNFDKPERAVTPGQSAVFYDGEKMLGGGIII